MSVAIWPLKKWLNRETTASPENWEAKEARVLRAISDEELAHFLAPIFRGIHAIGCPCVECKEAGRRRVM